MHITYRDSNGRKTKKISSNNEPHEITYNKVSPVSEDSTVYTIQRVSHMSLCMMI